MNKAANSPLEWIRLLASARGVAKSMGADAADRFIRNSGKSNAYGVRQLRSFISNHPDVRASVASIRSPLSVQEQKLKAFLAARSAPVIPLKPPL